MLIPVLFTVLLAMVQPGIILYDRMVMNAAAAEGCRLLATRIDGNGSTEEDCVQVVKRHLGAVPQQDLFHIHDGGCSWQVELDGNASSQEVGVRISNQVKLLPLFDAAGNVLGLANRGRYTITVEQRAQVKPSWYSG